MGSSGSITRIGSSGSYSYNVVAGSENEPVEYVSFFDGVRFSNCLHNSQPTGPQGPATTETGAYMLAGAASVGDRNPGAKFFLPTEDEWYKAAYYDSASTSFFSTTQLPPTRQSFVRRRARRPVLRIAELS